jgi:hypothetical protein
MATKKSGYKKGGPVKRQGGGAIPMPAFAPPAAPARRAAPARKVASKKSAPSKSKSKSKGSRGKLPSFGSGTVGLGGTGASGMIP